MSRSGKSLRNSESLNVQPLKTAKITGRKPSLVIEKIEDSLQFDLPVPSERIVYIIMIILDIQRVRNIYMSSCVDRRRLFARIGRESDS